MATDSFTESQTPYTLSVLIIREFPKCHFVGITHQSSDWLQCFPPPALWAVEINACHSKAVTVVVPMDKQTLGVRNMSLFTEEEPMAVT